MEEAELLDIATAPGGIAHAVLDRLLIYCAHGPHLLGRRQHRAPPGTLPEAEARSARLRTFHWSATAPTTTRSTGLRRASCNASKIRCVLLWATTEPRKATFSVPRFRGVECTSVIEHAGWTETPFGITRMRVV